MTTARRILVLATSTGGGNWPPLAAITVGVRLAGHRVRCFGDEAIAHQFAAASIDVDVVPANDSLRSFLNQWRASGSTGPSPFRAWAESCLPAVLSLVQEFKPHLLISEIFTMELARLTKELTAVRWCCINPGFYFGPDSIRPLEADYAEQSVRLRRWFTQSIGDADLVLHATDPVFDPPPPSLSDRHRYVGPLMWELSGAFPAYLDAPGYPWVLLTLSSSPQEGEMALASSALQALAENPVRVLLTLSAAHPRSELGVVPANVRVEQFISHAQVLKRSCLVICHAGHGIVLKALYYGIPMVLVPWARDQPGVAARAAALGVAEIIAKHDLSPLRLSEAVQTVLGTPSFQENASRHARRLQLQDAVATAMTWIEDLLERS